MSLSSFKVYSYEKKKWVKRRNMTQKFSGLRYSVYVWTPKDTREKDGIVYIRRGNDERAYSAGFAPLDPNAWNFITEERIEEVFENNLKKWENV